MFSSADLMRTTNKVSGGSHHSRQMRIKLVRDPAIEEMHARADRALATWMLNFWATVRANTTTYDWSYAHYWDAVLDASERRGKNAFAGTARMFYELQDKRGWLDDYYDDENWITLALLHSYAVTGEAM